MDFENLDGDVNEAVWAELGRLFVAFQLMEHSIRMEIDRIEILREARGLDSTDERRRKGTIEQARKVLFADLNLLRVDLQLPAIAADPHVLFPHIKDFSDAAEGELNCLIAKALDNLLYVTNAAKGWIDFRKAKLATDYLNMSTACCLFQIRSG